jgi:hypothetical protein
MRASPPVSMLAFAVLLIAAGMFATIPSTPLAGEPITLSIIDTAGDLASTQAIIENYKKANPDKLRRSGSSARLRQSFRPRSRHNRTPAVSTSTSS